MGRFIKKHIEDDDPKGVGALAGMEKFEKTLEELEELESIRAYDAAKASNDESTPLDQAFREIEHERA